MKAPGQLKVRKAIDQLYDVQDEEIRESGNNP